MAAATAAPRRVRRSALAPAVATVLALVFFAGFNSVYWGHLNDSRIYVRDPAVGDPGIFIRAGSMFAGHPERLPRGAPLLRGPGYDGQFYFYMARDPFLFNRADTTSRLDTPAYRYQRIGYSLAAWVLSAGGQPAALQWVLPLLNIATLGLLAYLLAAFLARRGVSHWWALLAPLSMGAVVGVVNDLADPFAGGMLMIGLLLWAEGRRGPVAGAALATAALARETYLAPVLAVALFEVWRHRRSGLPWLIPLVPALAWGAWTRLTLGDPTAGNVEKPSAIPFEGVFTKVSDLLTSTGAGHPIWETAFIVTTLVGWVVVAAVAIKTIGGQSSLSRSSRVAWLLAIGLLGVVTLPFLTALLWRNPLSYSRYAVILPVLLVIAFGLRRSFAAGLVASVLLILTIANPFVPIIR